MVKNPIPYSFKVKNNPEVRGLITSSDGLIEAIDKALEVYQTEEVYVALRRIGKGICPKSFPLSPQSLYFLDLFRRTHGGDYGLDLLHLPLAGGAIEQPNLFYSGMDVITRIRSLYYNKKMKDASQNQIHRQTDTREGNSQGPKSSFGSRRGNETQ